MNKTATQVLEKQYADAAAKAIAEEIDWELISDMMVAVGWTKVTLPKFRVYGPTVDMNNWMHNECKHYWKHRGNTWVFESQEEAALFKLTWS
jgi:hypothetical protein